MLKAMMFGSTNLPMPSPVVVLLFDHGQACKDVNILHFADGLQTHQQKFPELWTPWRKHWGKVQIQNKTGWMTVDKKNQLTPLKSGFRLNNRYSRASGHSQTTGGFGTVQNQMVMSASRIQFFKNGRFEQSAITMQNFKNENVHNPNDYFQTTGHRKNGAQTGRYHIDDYLLTLNFDNGPTEYRLIFAGKQKDSILNIDGQWYLGSKK